MEDVNRSFNVEAFYGTLIDKSPLGIAIQAPDGKVIRANRTFCDLFGYAMEEVIGVHLDDLVARDEGLSSEAGSVSTRVTGGENAQLEAVRTRKDGSKIPVSIRGVPIWENGRILAVYALYEDISERWEAEKQISREKALFERVLLDSPDGIAIFNSQGVVTRTNPAFEQLFGLDPGEALGHPLWEVVGRGNKDDDVRDNIDRIMGEKRVDHECVRLKKDGSEVHVSVRATAITKQGGSEEYLAIYRDITERIKWEQDRATERVYFENLFMNSPLAIALLDGDGVIQRVNSSFEKLFGYASWECIGRNLDGFIAPGDLTEDAEKLTRKVAGGGTVKAERSRRRKDGSWVDVQINAVSFPVAGEQTVIYAIYQDVTERKVYEEKIRYFGYHDALTGLFNSAYFEEETRRLDTPRQLPVSLIMADVDNLKLVNDAFGHIEGDRLIVEAGKILQSCCRQEDIIARCGGDEFVMLLPRTSLLEARSICDRIRAACSRGTRGMIPPSIALGVAVKNEVTQDFIQVRKKADDDMYLDKLMRSEHSRSAIYSRIVNFLEADPRRNNHISRLRKLSGLFASLLSMKQDETGNLLLLAQFHDIGLMPIPAEVLYREGALDPEEWEDLRKHPERGYHLARNLSPITPVAEDILCHHEHFDGSGYPRGLAGDGIPLLSRIMNMLCAYEVMTGWRSYKPTFSHEEALEEIASRAGGQFDPRLAGLFINMQRSLEREGKLI
jgi:diguanylate cyclase (GGDEF)-like protein/PAS domain S-box-containing protein